MRVAIIGAGLAGTACAYVLKSYGAEPVIYEAGDCIAPGASGNAVGLYNPRLSAERSPEADFYMSAFALALRTFPELDDIGWNPCGALHLVTDDDRRRKFTKCIENWSWPEEEMRLLSAAEASEVAGVTLSHEALYLPQAGSVSPRRLCEAYAKDVEVNLNTRVHSLSSIEADAIVLACGVGVKEFFDLPLGQVRGQITGVQGHAVSKNLKCNLCYGGYFTPAVDGAHIIGASFERNTDHDRISDSDDAENIQKLAAVAPGLAAGLEVTGRRASVRTTSKDHFPLIGAASDRLYVSTSHGSHGILSSLAGAHLLADMMLDQPRSLPSDVVERLSPLRF